MIKIIKKGTRTTKECPKCGCLFSYEEGDTKTDSCGLGIMPVYYEKYINCPQCKNHITLEATR